MFGVTRANRAVIYSTIKLQNLKWFVNVETTTVAIAAKKKKDIFVTDLVMPAIMSGSFTDCSRVRESIRLPSALLLLVHAGSVLDTTMSCRCGFWIAPFGSQTCNWVWKCYIYIILLLWWEWFNQFHDTISFLCKWDSMELQYLPYSSECCRKKWFWLMSVVAPKVSPV